eukprot:scaffold2081_cov255-Amphora_coffeaeformis.AAC.1
MATFPSRLLNIGHATSSTDEHALLLRAAGISEDNKDDDYARLSHYLHCALTLFGVHAIDPDAFAYHAATADTARKVNIIMLATGKQFGLESLSYKTVLLDDQNILSAGEHARHVTVPDAVERYGIQLDPLLLGGMIPVQTTHVMICSLEWVRTFYAEPTKRLKESSIASPGGGHRLGGAPREDDDNGRTAPPMVSGPEIRALFVRNSTVAAMEEDVHDMTSKLQGLIAAKRQAKASSSQQTQSFTGQ